MKNNKSDYYKKERLNPEYIETVQDSDPTFLVEFFLAPIIVSLIIGIILFIYLPQFNETAFFVSIALGFGSGIYLGFRVKNKKGNSKYYLPLDNTNDIKDWNVRDTNIRNERLANLKKQIDLELKKIKNENLINFFKEWEKDYYAQNRIFNNNDLKNYKECWVIFDDKKKKKCISYCEDVFLSCFSWKWTKQ